MWVEKVHINSVSYGLISKSDICFLSWRSGSNWRFILRVNGDDLLRETLKMCFMTVRSLFVPTEGKWTPLFFPAEHGNLLKPKPQQQRRVEEGGCEFTDWCAGHMCTRPGGGDCCRNHTGSSCDGRTSPLHWDAPSHKPSAYRRNRRDCSWQRPADTHTATDGGKVKGKEVKVEERKQSWDGRKGDRLKS